MKTIFKKCSLLFGLIIIFASAAGCGKKDDTTGISIVEGQYKTTYFVGETLDTQNLNIEVLNTENTFDIISVTPDMIKGFNSAAVKSRQKLTIQHTKDGKTKAVHYYVDIVPAGYKKYTSEKVNLYYPESWIETTVNGVKAFADPAMSQCNINYIVINLHDPNYKNYTAEMFEKSLSAQLKTEVKMDIFEKITFSNEKAIRMTYPVQSQIYMEQLLIFRKSDSITFTFTQPLTDPIFSMYADMKKLIYFN